MHCMRCDERKRNQQYLMAATGDSTQLNSLQEEHIERGVRSGEMQYKHGLRTRDGANRGPSTGEAAASPAGGRTDTLVRVRRGTGDGASEKEKRKEVAAPGVI